MIAWIFSPAQSQAVPITNSGSMGDTSPKNKHKLEEQKHEDHVKKEDEKHENAERQHHHPDSIPDAEQVVGLPEAKDE